MGRTGISCPGPVKQDKKEERKVIMGNRKTNRANRIRIRSRVSFAVCWMIVCISLTLTACGKDKGVSKNNLSEEGNAAGIAQEREWVYVPEVIMVGDEHADYGRMQLVGDTFCYALQSGETDSSAINMYRYSLSGRELTCAPVDWSEGGENWDLGTRYFARDGSLYLTANVYSADYGSMKRLLCKFDSEGKCLFSRDITEQAGKGVSLERLAVDGQGRIYIFVSDREEILLYTDDGDYHGSVSYRSSNSPVPAEVRGACEGADGKYYVCIGRRGADIAGENTGDSGSEVHCFLAEISFEDARLKQIAENLPAIKGFCAGKQYDLLLYDDRAVYGFRFASQNSYAGAAGDELFVWMEGDINGYFVTGLYLSEEGKLCATVEDWENDDRAIVMLERTKADQTSRREELVLATVNGGSSLAAMAVKFNRGSSRYHLTVQSYGSLAELYNALLAKNAMDLIDLSGINVQKLTAGGILEDLAPYLEQSEILGRSDFVEGIPDVYTFDNTLAGIPAAFTLRTVAGDGGKAENREGLTLEALLAAELDSGTKTFDGVARDEMMQYIMMFNEDTFIDRESGTCHFDSETFKEVLEYVNRFPDSAEDDREVASLPVKIRNGEVMYAIAELNSLRAFQEYEGMFGGEAACVGFPTPDGGGGHLLLTGDAYGIAAVSEHKEGAWKFIEEFLAQEKSESYYGNIFTCSFPTLKKVLNQKVEEAIETDDQYESGHFPELIYNDGTTFQFHALTWDDVNAMLALVPDAKPCFQEESDEIIKIINEEASGFYSGQRGAEDTAAIIQNRVQLYVNEIK